jgi:type IV secretory pathway VirJ component
MMKSLLLKIFICISTLITANCYAQYQPEIFRWGDFGNTQIYAGGTSSGQLILTDTPHYQQAISYAQQLSQQGNLSAVLSIDNYLTNIAQRNASCFDAATPLSVYAQDIQQHHQFPHFTQPFVTGFGTAGSYLFAMLTQIPSGILRGAYSIDWSDNIPVPIEPCINSSQITWLTQQRRVSLNSFPLPPTPWQLFNSHPLIQHWMPDYPLLKNWQSDKQLFESSLDKIQVNPSKKAIAHLPLIEIPSNNTNDELAIIISGDGGWANIDKDIANQLAKEGIASVGWNSLDYFWEEKTPAIAGHDLQATIDYYTNTWKKKRLLLIGFSMGADVMPFMVNRLNNETRAKILSVNLLNPSTSVDFVFHLSGWLGNSDQATHLLYPEMKNWNQWPTRCFYSEKNASLCEEIQEHSAQKPDNQELIFLPGDHHFDGNYQQLVKLILNKKP